MCNWIVGDIVIIKFDSRSVVASWLDAVVTMKALIQFVAMTFTWVYKFFQGFCYLRLCEIEYGLSIILVMWD